MADGMLAEGVYVIAFSYPVVPRDSARIRVQISAALTAAELDMAIAAFSKMGKELNVV
jgi:glycine C-acetyltransferase